MLKINMPDKDVVKMLSCNSKLAEEVYQMTLHDPVICLGTLMEYLGHELLNLEWPTYTTPQEEKDAFFQKWREKIISMNWADEDYDFTLLNTSNIDWSVFCANSNQS